MGPGTAQRNRRPCAEEPPAGRCVDRVRALADWCRACAGPRPPLRVRLAGQTPGGTHADKLGTFVATGEVVNSIA